MSGYQCPCYSCEKHRTTAQREGASVRRQAIAELLDEARCADIAAFKAAIRAYTRRRSFGQRLLDRLPFTITWKKP